jgi:hypothetical protein
LFGRQYGSLAAAFPDAPTNMTISMSSSYLFHLLLAGQQQWLQPQHPLHACYDDAGEVLLVWL